jgi:hypothetical protein
MDLKWTSVEYNAKNEARTTPKDGPAVSQRAEGRGTQGERSKATSWWRREVVCDGRSSSPYTSEAVANGPGLFTTGYMYMHLTGVTCHLFSGPHEEPVLEPSKKKLFAHYHTVILPFMVFALMLKEGVCRVCGAERKRERASFRAHQIRALSRGLNPCFRSKVSFAHTHLTALSRRFLLYCIEASMSVGTAREYSSKSKRAHSLIGLQTHLY